MKKYEKPTMSLILLKSEERLAASHCTCCGSKSGYDSEHCWKTHLNC